MARFLERLIQAQSVWARPFGDRVHSVVHSVFHAVPWLRDLLNGRLLGHPLHAALTDLPIGILGLAVVLDLAGDPSGAGIALVLALLAMLASAAAGLADYADTDGTPRTTATVHGTLMVVATLLVLKAVLAHGVLAGTVPDQLTIAIEVVAFGIVLLGAFVGGDVVYALGNMVNRHAFLKGGVKWAALEPAELDASGAIPEGRPIKAKLGANALVLVRQGETVLALADACAHAGGPLSSGKLVDGCLECPWHGSRFRATDGHVTHGPSVYDQPAYEVRRSEAGGWEARRATA